jgi:hypothetical protein
VTEPTDADWQAARELALLARSGVGGPPVRLGAIAQALADARAEGRAEWAARCRDLEYALNRVESLTYADGAGLEHEHHYDPCPGEDDCPRCWAESIRNAIR